MFIVMVKYVQNHTLVRILDPGSNRGWVKSCAFSIPNTSNEVQVRTLRVCMYRKYLSHIHFRTHTVPGKQSTRISQLKNRLNLKHL